MNPKIKIKIIAPGSDLLNICLPSKLSKKSVNFLPDFSNDESLCIEVPRELFKGEFEKRYQLLKQNRMYYFGMTIPIEYTNFLPVKKP